MISDVSNSEPEVYVKIRVGKLIKTTQTTTINKGRTVVDDIRHFSVNVSGISIMVIKVG